MQIDKDWATIMQVRHELNPGANEATIRTLGMTSTQVVGEVDLELAFAHLKEAYLANRAGVYLVLLDGSGPKVGPHVIAYHLADDAIPDFQGNTVTIFDPDGLMAKISGSAATQIHDMANKCREQGEATAALLRLTLPDIAHESNRDAAGKHTEFKHGAARGPMQ